jgi:purine-nucleoside phosphorylase
MHATSTTESVAASIFEQAEAAAAFIRQRLEPATHAVPEIAIVLGSGLGEVANQVADSIAIPYAEIPHFPQSTVEGHSGRLVVGTLAGTPVAVMQGRVHAYEGYTQEQVTFPTRVLGRLGVKKLVVTNAAGGIHLDYHQGQLVLISDHINFTGLNPARGANDARFGLRFFDMSDAYSKRLRSVARNAGRQIGLALAEGVYLCVPGPSFETPAEIRAFRTLGADLVGMSTVPEVIVARHMGIEVLGISCVTNMAAGIQAEPLNHVEVMETGRRVEKQLSELLAAIVPRM